MRFHNFTFGSKWQINSNGAPPRSWHHRRRNGIVAKEHIIIVISSHFRRCTQCRTGRSRRTIIRFPFCRRDAFIRTGLLLVLYGVRYLFLRNQRRLNDIWLWKNVKTRRVRSYNMTSCTYSITVTAGELHTSSGVYRNYSQGTSNISSPSEKLSLFLLIWWYILLSMHTKIYIVVIRKKKVLIKQFLNSFFFDSELTSYQLFLRNPIKLLFKF